VSRRSADLLGTSPRPGSQVTWVPARVQSNRPHQNFGRRDCVPFNRFAVDVAHIGAESTLFKIDPQGQVKEWPKFLIRLYGGAVRPGGYRDADGGPDAPGSPTHCL